MGKLKVGWGLRARNTRKRLNLETQGNLIREWKFWRFNKQEKRGFAEAIEKGRIGQGVIKDIKI